MYNTFVKIYLTIYLYLEDCMINSPRSFFYKFMKDIFNLSWIMIFPDMVVAHKNVILVQIVQNQVT